MAVTREAKCIVFFNTHGLNCKSGSWPTSTLSYDCKVSHSEYLYMKRSIALLKIQIRFLNLKFYFLAKRCMRMNSHRLHVCTHKFFYLVWIQRIWTMRYVILFSFFMQLKCRKQRFKPPTQVCVHWPLKIRYSKLLFSHLTISTMHTWISFFRFGMKDVITFSDFVLWLVFRTIYRVCDNVHKSIRPFQQNSIPLKVIKIISYNFSFIITFPCFYLI